MNLETLWQDINERELARGGPSGLVVRRIDPQYTDDLFVGTRMPGGTRVVLLRIPFAPVIPRDALVQSRGFVTHITRFEHDPEGSCDLVLETTDASFNGVFGVLAEDLVGRVIDRSPNVSAGSTFLGALQQWKRFFDAAGAEGLSNEQQLGLFAELSFLDEMALAQVGDPVAAVAGWVGPDPLSNPIHRLNI